MQPLHSAKYESYGRFISVFPANKGKHLHSTGLIFLQNVQSRLPKSPAYRLESVIYEMRNINTLTALGDYFISKLVNYILIAFNISLLIF